MTLRLGLFAATMTFSFALSTQALAQDANAQIKRDLSILEKETDAAAANAVIAGKPAFTVKQSEKLFDSLKISSGVSPGEERMGFVVCTGGGISMGNLSVPQCTIQAEMPATVAEHCKEAAKSSSSRTRSIRRGH